MSTTLEADPGIDLVTEDGHPDLPADRTEVLSPAGSPESLHSRATDILHVRGLVHTLLRRLDAAGQELPQDLHDRLGLNGLVTTPLAAEGAMELPLPQRSALLHELEHHIRALASHSRY